MSDIQSSNTQTNYPNGRMELPNSVAVLVLGIISIAFCGVGLVTGIIALIMAGKARKLYDESPNEYTASSYSNMKAGRICAIIGVILSSLVIVVYIFYFVFLFSMIATGVASGLHA